MPKQLLSSQSFVIFVSEHSGGLNSTSFTTHNNTVGLYSFLEESVLHTIRMGHTLRDGRAASLDYHGAATVTVLEVA